MCNRSCIAFGSRLLDATIVKGRDVLDVGALDVNGSLRPWVESLGPSRYVGVDLTLGPGVDEVVDATKLVERFGSSSFDVVISTEMVEHTLDWRAVVSNLKRVLRPGGYLLLTTRSPGFAYHAWPYDFWRYTVDDMRAIFADLEILTVEPDPQDPGVFVFARRPPAFVEQTPEIRLTSMVTGARELAVTPWQIRVAVVRQRAAAAWAAILAPVRRRAVAARKLRPRVVRARNAAWRRLPLGVRSAVKRVLRRS